MGFLGIWLATIVVSFGIDVMDTFRISKMAADEGYKINNKKILELGNDISPELVKTSLFTMFVPIVNVLNSMYRSMKINMSSINILDQYGILGVLKEMSDYEKCEYAKNPTGFNAIKVSILYEAKLADAIEVKVHNENENFEVYLDYDKSSGMKILKCSGSVMGLSDKEVLKKVKEHYKEMMTVPSEELKIVVNSEDINEEEKQKLANIIRENITTTENTRSLEEKEDKENTLKLKK